MNLFAVCVPPLILWKVLNIFFFVSQEVHHLARCPIFVKPFSFQSFLDRNFDSSKMTASSVVPFLGYGRHIGDLSLMTFHLISPLSIARLCL